MTANPSADEPLEVRSSRILAFPRAQVYEAFRHPASLASWWGPQGFTNTFHEFDLRPGGVWRFTMKGPGGAEYAQNKRFAEVVEGERITLEHSSPEHSFRMTMTFADHPAGTELVWLMEFAPSPHNAGLRDFIPQANEQNFDRLEACLAALSS